MKFFKFFFQFQFAYFPKDFAPEILQKLQIDSNASIGIRIILFGFLLPRFFTRTATRTPPRIFILTPSQYFQHPKISSKII